MDAAEFDRNAFAAALETAAIGRHLVYRRSVGSTMDVAREEAATGAPHGTLVLAEEQRAGRGRRGRGFHSPAGENLYFTLVLRLTPEQHRRVPIGVPLAVCEAVVGEGIPARIKWPNDIWIGDLKTCGMLIDAELVAGGAIAFPGIGINVNGDPTRIEELRGIATSLANEFGRPVPRERLLAGICNGLEAALETPTEELVARYRGLSMVMGREVTIAPSGGSPYEAVAEGIADDGSLVVRRGGELLTVNAADVSVRPRG